MSQDKNVVLRQFAVQLAMRLAEEGFGVWWEDVHNDATQTYATRFRLEFGEGRFWVDVSDRMVLGNGERCLLMDRLVAEIVLKFWAGGIPL